MEETVQSTELYLRNWRPNSVTFTYGGLRYKLERRGHREDSVSLPVEAKNDKTIARWLKLSVVEEISKDDFISLVTRTEDVGYDLAKPKSPDLPMGDYNQEIDMKLPYTIPGKLLEDNAFKQGNMSPEIKYAKEPPTTADEVKALEKSSKKKG